MSFNDTFQRPPGVEGDVWERIRFSSPGGKFFCKFTTDPNIHRYRHYSNDRELFKLICDYFTTVSNTLDDDTPIFYINAESSLVVIEAPYFFKYIQTFFENEIEYKEKLEQENKEKGCDQIVLKQIREDIDHLKQRKSHTMEIGKDRFQVAPEHIRIFLRYVIDSYDRLVFLGRPGLTINEVLDTASCIKPFFQYTTATNQNLDMVIAVIKQGAKEVCFNMFGRQQEPTYITTKKKSNGTTKIKIVIDACLDPNNLFEFQSKMYTKLVYDVFHVSPFEFHIANNLCDQDGLWCDANNSMPRVNQLLANSCVNTHCSHTYQKKFQAPDTFDIKTLRVGIQQCVLNEARGLDDSTREAYQREIELNIIEDDIFATSGI